MVSDPFRLNTTSAPSTISDFSEHSTTKQNIGIAQPKGNTLYLDVKSVTEDDLDVTYLHHKRIRFGDWMMISKDENSFRLAYPVLNILPSETDSFALIAVKSACGFDKKDAAYRAKNINYGISQVDSSINFNTYFDVQTLDKLRAQEVKLILKVPINKVVFLSNRMEKIIFDIDNVNDALDRDMVNRKWIMTKQGLECVDCEGLENIHQHNSVN